jgi:Deoxycytidylate deaminase
MITKWQLAYMEAAQLFASLSTAKRLKVGAIIVKEDRIISIGYNGTPKGWDNTCEQDGVTKPEVIHAEANAIAKLAKSHESGEGADMYITHSPCVECAKLIATSGIRVVYFFESYRSQEGIEFLQKCNIDVFQVRP